jgi:hypothetical protein
VTTIRNQSIQTIVPKYSVILSQDRLVTLGFVYHPAVLMWLGHSNSLKEYINACINEWIHRGFSNNMILYQITENETKPEWVLNPEMHKNHKGALYIKEIARNESPWYCLKSDFVEAGLYYQQLPVTTTKSTSDFQHYIWPYN